jgi:hypothetical protein
MVIEWMYQRINQLPVITKDKPNARGDEKNMYHGADGLNAFSLEALMSAWMSERS